MIDLMSMEPRTPSAHIEDLDVGAIAWEYLKAGECVVLPTDTVYGIAVLASDREAIARLQQAKGRADEFPPPVMVADIDQAWEFVAPPKPYAQRLAERFWPGGLTLILPTERTDLSLAEQTKTLGIRIPALTPLRALLRLTGPLAVSSANTHGFDPATNLEEAISQLGAQVSLYIDGGPTPGAIPSTVVDCSGEKARILRVGLISPEEIMGGPDA